MYKILITTSGIGSRLGSLTQFTNKSLVRVGKKPAISYIVESYPKDIEMVITLGHYGDHVKDFLTLAYPNRNFNFVKIDNYNGEGSSLGYSIIQAKKHLQCPFIFHAADTIVFEDINPPTHNWLGSCYKENNSQYRTISFNKNKIIYDKGDMNSNFAYVGLAGINDYQQFWDSLEKEYYLNPKDSTLSDCHAINKMIVKDWKIYKYDSWLDVGNVSELKHARKMIKDKFDLLDKTDESIFIFDDFVIKFFHDSDIVKNRARRCVLLGNLTPTLLEIKNNFYKYKIVEGELLSSALNEGLFRRFLDWSIKNLWIKHRGDLTEKCYDFYFNKTEKRLNSYFQQNSIIDTTEKINGFTIPPVKELMELINKKWLCSKSSYQFHGDYILDNIIYEGEDNFKLLDWRQDFAGDLENGDIYYDLAKLNHNLIFNHAIVNKRLFTLEEQNGFIKCDILRSDILKNCQDILHDFIIDHKLDLKKVKLITSLIWLNMAPLHDTELGKFLFYFGKLNLYKILNEK